jgi:rod shape-determining protein MreD
MTMRWLSYFILAYIMLGMQLGLGGHLQYRGAGPNLVLLVVVFISLNAPRDEALLGSFLLGAMQDLVTLQPMGLYAFSYGLVAMFISTVAQLAYREHPLTQFFMALMGGMMTGIVLLIHGWIYPVGPARMENGVLVHAVRLGPRVIAVSIGYTALLAPIVLGILQRMKGMFGFESPRRKSRMGN